MSFAFHDKPRENPEWMPPAGYHLFGVYALNEAQVDYKGGKGPEDKAEWCFVVLQGEHKGKRIIEHTGYSFFAGNGNLSPATAYKWVRVLRFKGAPPPADYQPVSDDIIGRIAYGTCFINPKGYLRLSTDLVSATALPDGLTLEDINATLEQARIDHAAEAARVASAADNGGYSNGATMAPAGNIDAELPF